MARLRTSSGKSSARSAPKPAVQPEPNPSSAITAQKSAGWGDSASQRNASSASATAVIDEYTE